MKRTTIALLIALATAASAIAAIPRGEATAFAPATMVRETVIEKNQAFPLVGPLTVEECLDASCSVTRG